MDTNEVSAGIEQLVDHLRNNHTAAVNLGDVAGVTEILLATMRRYFNSIDTTLYTEFRGLSEYIQRARTEISELRPNDLKEEKIPRAGLELEAIVASTEEATGTIMDAAEEIMSADPASEEYADAVNDACMRIFEACSFQDITGQRITKVVTTLTYIEERLHGLQDAWGPDIADAEGEAPVPGEDKDQRPDKDLLNGPALEGEGILQNQVDDLFGDKADIGETDDAGEMPIMAASDAEASDSEEIDDDEGTTGQNGQMNGFSQDEDDADFVVEEPDEDSDSKPDIAAKGDADEPKLDDIVALNPNEDEGASQDDIDALFD